jgi:hypothetical protein
MPTDGMAASFGSAMGDINTAEDSINTLFPTDASGSPDTSAITAAGTANEEYIKAQGAQSADTIASNKAAGDLNRSKALDLLRLGPAGIKQNIDSFIEQSDAFDKGISDDIAALDAQENSALANNDANTAAQIRQTKLDYFNMKLGAAQTKASTLTSFYSAMLSGKTEQLQEESFAQSSASNILNTLMPAYAGTDFSKLPADVQTQFQNAATTLGIPISTLQSLVGSDSATMHVSRGNYTYFFDAKGKQVGAVYTPTATGADPSTEWQSFLNGNATKLTSADNQSALNNMQSDVIGSPILGARTLMKNVLGKGTISNATTFKYGSGSYDMTTSGGIEQFRKDLATSIVKSLSPQTAATYLGVQASVMSLSADQTNQLTSLVRAELEQDIPDAYVQGIIGAGSQPLSGIDDTSTGLTAAQVQSQIDDNTDSNQ